MSNAQGDLRQSASVGEGEHANKENSLSKRRARTPEELQQLKQLLNHLVGEAVGWFQAATRCNASIAIKPNLYSCLSNQAVVCNAFAIELYIKGLLVHDEQDPPRNEHNCYVLFMMLPKEIRDLANARMARYMFDPAASVEDYLRTNGDRFVRFRYLYERIAEAIANGKSEFLPGTNFRQYWAVTESLHDTIIKLAPNVKVLGDHGYISPLQPEQY